MENSIKQLQDKIKVLEARYEVERGEHFSAKETFTKNADNRIKDLLDYRFTLKHVRAYGGESIEYILGIKDERPKEDSYQTIARISEGKLELTWFSSSADLESTPQYKLYINRYFGCLALLTDIMQDDFKLNDIMSTIQKLDKVYEETVANLYKITKDTELERSQCVSELTKLLKQERKNKAIEMLESGKYINTMCQFEVVGYNMTSVKLIKQSKKMFTILVNGWDDRRIKKETLLDILTKPNRSVIKKYSETLNSLQYVTVDTFILTDKKESLEALEWNAIIFNDYVEAKDSLGVK